MKRKGFTLIELLIVIAIIAILATIIILNVLNARAKANDAAVLSSLKSVQSAFGVCIVGSEYPNLQIPADEETGSDSGAIVPIFGSSICCKNQTVESGAVCTPSTEVKDTFPEISQYKGTKGPWMYDNAYSSYLRDNRYSLAACSSTTRNSDYCGGDQNRIECTPSGCAKY